MKLHLGSGKRFIPGYVHIDAIDFPHIDHVSTIDNLPFIQGNTISVIYNCHVLEHFKRADVDRVLREWYRVLKPGGILRTSVPDFQKVCEVYTKFGQIEKVFGPIFGRQDYLYNIHYNIFDFKYLTEKLDKAGFTEIKRYDWNETEHADIDDYSQSYIPHMDKKNGLLMSLNVECKKGI